MPDSDPSNEEPSQHYVFAHWVLPQVAHERGAWLLSVLAGKDGARLLDDLWQRAGDEMAPAQLRSSEGLRHVVSITPEGRVVALIGLPPPGESTEAHTIGVFAKLKDRTDISYTNLGEIRVFSLDRGEEADAESFTVLGEWTADREHLDLGPGPEPEDTAFVQACLQRLEGEPRMPPH